MVKVTHAFVPNIADDPAAAAKGEVLISHWNADHTVTGIREVLTANRSYFVAATGNDAHDGLTSGTAWLTLQHAMHVIASTLDIAAFTVTVHVGAGTFAGFGVETTVGGGTIQFSGAGIASTTITASPNDGVFNFGDCFDWGVACSSLIAIDSITWKPSDGLSALAIFTPGANFVNGDIAALTGFVNFDCTGLTGGNSRVINVSSLSLITDVGNNTANMSGANIQTFATISQGAVYESVGTIFSGNFTVQRAVLAAIDGSFFEGASGLSWSTTGTITGPVYEVVAAGIQVFPLPFGGSGASPGIRLYGGMASGQF